ncbi:hypothetical protein RJ639_008804 [Escallonia herrerae]|uniref:Integrase catalytic domain-containing protein n=1 Tax=Escallonia herrerae TaxID=1293975 RepID=A0AA88VSE0_9ASTE|nr:hypothetical protein RJ639_008804 [Escallonia herrerae]
MAFEVGNEKFRMIPFPGGASYSCKAVPVGDHFTLVDRSNKAIWILTDYSEQLWRKASILLQEHWFDGVVGTIHTSEVLFKWDGIGASTQPCLYYDIESETARMVTLLTEVDGRSPPVDGFFASDAAKHVECLFRLKAEHNSSRILLADYPPRCLGIHEEVWRLPTLLLNPQTVSKSLSSLSSPIQFAMWGMDIMGPFPLTTAQHRFVIVAIDYFTKWVEAEALVTISEKKCEDLFWRVVVCRFGIPRVLVTDNGKQFDNTTFRTFCTNLTTEQRFSSVAHPQTNGQTEVTN